MLVDLIAYTKFDANLVQNLYKRHTDDQFFDNEEDSDELAEFAGRTCYLSYDRPNPKTSTNQAYLDHILESGHESVLEHSSASFYVEGVSRNLLIELERHRFLSFSVVSTRYVDANELRLVEPMANGGASRDLRTEELGAYYFEYWKQRGAGKTMKQAREAAAYHLPGGLETRFVVTGNLRAWRDVLRKRNHPAANAEIKAFAVKVQEHLIELAPNSFQDMTDAANEARDLEEK